MLTGACQFGHGVGGFVTNFIHSHVLGFVLKRRPSTVARRVICALYLGKPAPESVEGVSFVRAHESTHQKPPRRVWWFVKGGATNGSTTRVLEDRGMHEGEEETEVDGRENASGCDVESAGEPL